MKKKILILTLMTSTVFFSLSACKSKSEPQPTTVEQPTLPAQVQTAAPTANDIINQIIVPTFSNPEVTKFCTDFKDLMVEYAQSKGSSDQVKEAELEKKFTDWATQATQLAGKIKPEELNQFNNFITTAQAKFSEMAQAVTAN